MTAALRVRPVALSTDRIVVPAVMFGPTITMPADKPAVLVTVAAGVPSVTRPLIGFGSAILATAAAV